MWLNLVFYMAFCRRAISESPGLRTIYMISVFIVSTCYVAHETSQGFLTGAGSRIPVAYDEGGPVKFMVFCRQAISESPDLRTMYMTSVFIGCYMCVAHETSQGFLTGAGSRIPVANDKGGPVKFIAFCGRAISESPGLRTIYMIGVFISVYMLC